MRRPIAISLSPNTKSSDVFLTFKLLFSPWKYLNGDYPRILEQWFRNYFKVSYAVSFVSGRGALFAILKTLNVGLGDEVALQAFTCVAVCDAIIKAGAKPVFIDIDNSLTMDPKDLERKITARTKAIIVQHTFGIPSDLTKIIEITKDQGIKVIEDCAHVVGGEYKNKKLGLFGEMAFFSFGRDKAFSSVFGGMAVTNNEFFGKKIKFFQKQQSNPSFFWVAQQLFHPIAFYLILPIYNFCLFGKVLLVFFQVLHFLSFPVAPEEKQGKLPSKFIKKLPNALANLALLQIKRVGEYNQKRKEISTLYLQSLKNAKVVLLCQKPLPFLRFPVLVDDRDKTINFFKKRGVYLGKWYSEIVDPKGVDFKKILYQRGSCPNAEYIAKRIINLPTYPLMDIDDAQKVVDLLKQYDKNARN